MAPSKRTMLFVCLLVAAVPEAVPIAQGQTIGGLIATLLGIIRVQGVVYRSANGRASVGTNGTTPAPAFPNAKVQLRCGAGNGVVTGTVKTNSNGTFSFVLDIFFTERQILMACRVVVTTPLGSCKVVTLPPTGRLTSTLMSLGNTTFGSFPTINIGISGFNFIV